MRGFAGTPHQVIDAPGNPVPYAAASFLVLPSPGKLCIHGLPYGVLRPSTALKHPNAKTVAYQYNDGRLRTQMTDQFSGVLWFAQDLLGWPVRKA